MATPNDRHAHLVVDLTFGDAGKGTVTDYLARRHPVHTVIRFNGGAQAGHNVVTDDGRHHTFSQFGSATFVPGVRTHLSRHVIVNPLSMMAEERKLAGLGAADAFARTTISADALVVTPFQRAANRLREIARSEGLHGSCGMGIGETQADSLLLGGTVVRAGDLRRSDALRRKLRWLQSYKREQLRDAVRYCREQRAAAEEIACLEDERMIDIYLEQLAPFVRAAVIREEGFLREILARPGDVIFEGAQGVLLDEWRGFHPFTTWSTCTFANALGILDEHAYDGAIEKLGVVRAYATRHGPGPFVTEDAALGAAIPDMHNRMNDWQRAFRIGWFDAVATRYAIAACGGIDAVAVTGLDRLRDLPQWWICEAYEMPDDPEDRDPRGEPFILDGAGLTGRIANIPLGPARDLSYQEALTERLLRAEPASFSWVHPGPFEARADDYLLQMARSLKVPIRYASFGPTSADKRFLG